MKKTLSKVLALILAVALVLPTLPTSFSAATWDNVPETNYASRYTSYYYTYGKFYENMTKIPLTGDGARDVVAVAASQMGYLEGDDSAGQDGVTGGSGNYTEYGAYTEVNAAAWCASFCSWVMYTAEVTDTRGTETYMARNGYYWSECYVPYWSNMLYEEGRYRFSDYYRSSYDSYQASYIPQPGDLVFFTAGYEPLDEGHIGIVAYSDGTNVYTLEGNTSSQDGVESEGGGAFFKSYSLSSSSIAGYGILPYETNEALKEIDYSGENPTPGLYVTTSGAKSVYLDINDSTPSWTLPMSSVFEVLEIDEDSDGLTMLYSKCEINGETVYGWIVHGSGSNGYTRTFQIYSSESKYDESIDADRDGIPDSYNPSKDASGNYTFENAYGYEFDIDGVDGVIGGEDAYIITTDDAYAACNPNWAISIQLRPTGNTDEYSVVKVAATPGSADAAGIALQDGDIVMVVHSASSASGQGYANWMDKVAAMALKEGDVVNVASDYSSVTVLEADDSEDPDEPDVPVDPDEPDVPVDPDEPDVPVDPDEPENEIEAMGEGAIKAQKNNSTSDIRLIAYVDKLELYSKVAFTLTIGDRVSKSLECKTAYSTLYTNTQPVTTQQIYDGKDGYFVTHTVKGFFDNIEAGQEVTITVTYTKVTGETFSCERTIQFGTPVEPEEPVVPDEPVVIETASLPYANAYDWTNLSNQIYVFASSDATATPASLIGQGEGFMGWWTGIVLEYNATNETWVVTSVNTPDGTNEAESETLGDNKMVIIFHSDAATGQPETYNFLTKYAVLGAELYLSGNFSRVQSASGSLSGIALATGKVESTTPTTEYNYDGAIGGAGLQGYTDNLYYGCDLSFYNVADYDYSDGSSLTDDGADYSLVDFERMKADGCDFVILRLGSEDSSGKYYDPHFVTYYNMAREAGLDIGVYYYSYAMSYDEAAEEAEFVIEVMEDHGMYFEYPIYIDIEESDQLALGETALSNVCYGWCETMVEAGYFPGIYGNYNLYDGISTQVKADYDFWLAYVSAADTMSTYNPSNTNVSAECGVWQYSFYGYEYDGIGLDMLDVNVSYKDYPAIMEAYGYNNVN